MALPTNVIKSDLKKAKWQLGGSTVTYGTVTVSGTYSQSEVQAISTAVTNLIATLRAQGLIK